ncbi:MAG: heparinase II/III-family protein, partial [Acetobacteraceae bacterium]|nr:heparinase II/III-family protein [Acetobacteraceae bacterium]
ADRAVAPVLPVGHRAAVLRAARAVGIPVPAAGFDHRAAAAAIRPLAGPDIRPVWEASRWAELPLLAQAARLEPEGGHLARAEAWLAAWLRVNPPFRGPNWACGQEAALRALHLALAGRLLGGLGPGAAPLAALLRRRIAAAPLYALAQDNNHPLSEAAGLIACAVIEGDRPAAGRAARRLTPSVLRLFGPDGGFAQDSPAYLRLALDVLAVADLLHPLEAPARERLAAAARLLHRLAAPGSGALPRLGHQDGSRFADLSLAGEHDARGSAERALRIFAGASAWPEDPGCAWLALPPRQERPPEAREWRGAGLWLRREGTTRAVLRLGPPAVNGRRFRPSHADALHLDLWDGDDALLPDAGTGAYNPGAGDGWWLDHFRGTAAHNTVAFDEADQMPVVSRFLHARWLARGDLPAGGWVRDHRGNRHAREVRVEGRVWTVTDSVSGPFGTFALRWHLAGPGWAATPDGAAGPRGRIALSADGLLVLSLAEGWCSPSYGVVGRRCLLVARARAPTSRVRTVITLPGHLPVESGALGAHC